jgi:hypothetical protein
MATMPRAANSIANLPSLLTLTNRDDVANDLMTRYDRERIAKGAGLDCSIGMADSCSENLNEDLAYLWGFESNVLQGERGIGLLEDGDLVALWKGSHVCNNSLVSRF